MKQANFFLIFATSFALTEWISWHFLETKIGNTPALQIVGLAATLHAMRVCSLLLQKALGPIIAWKRIVKVIWLPAYILAQLLVLGIEGVYTSEKQLLFVSVWIVANAVALTASIYLCEHVSQSDSCKSGTCH
jgi:hypothetical protein